MCLLQHGMIVLHVRIVPYITINRVSGFSLQQNPSLPHMEATCRLASSVEIFLDRKSLHNYKGKIQDKLENLFSVNVLFMTVGLTRHLCMSSTLLCRKQSSCETEA